VGESGKSYVEASLQLGVWCFAGLAKLDELRVQSRMADREAPTQVINEQIPAMKGGGCTVETENPALGPRLPLWTVVEQRKVSRSLDGQPSAWTGNYTLPIGTKLTMAS